MSDLRSRRAQEARDAFLRRKWSAFHAADARPRGATVVDAPPGRAFTATAESRDAVTEMAAGDALRRSGARSPRGRR